LCHGREQSRPFCFGGRLLTGFEKLASFLKTENEEKQTGP
jgi:hypothetical protein